MKLTIFIFVALTGRCINTLLLNEDDDDLWLHSGKFEGDMALLPHQRNGVTNTTLRWPNGIVPYEFSEHFSTENKTFIADTLSEVFSKTCVKPQPRKNERDYVLITARATGCWSNVGRIGGKQELHLSIPNCILNRTIVHEFLHTIGFYHQQSASERDDYVDIFWENISSGDKFNFHKYDSDNVTMFGEEYDYDSLLHYPKKAFSINGEPTILPKNRTIEIGVKKIFSPIDQRKVNKMYGCE